MSKLIPLTQNKFAIVDDNDFERLNQWKWYAVQEKHTWYAVRAIWNNGRAITIPMHRDILNSPNGMETDHKDHNGLNNCRYNLRLASRMQNQHNRESHCGTSKYKGVSWHKRDKKWQSQIRVNRKLVHLGCFDNEIEAAKVYNIKATELFGEFAYVNNL